MPIADRKSRRSRYFVNHYENSIWVRGADFKASFEAGQVRFYPFLGSDAPRLYPVQFSAPRVTMGEHSLDLGKASQPVEEEGTISIKRGSLKEWYRLNPDSIEQLFTLDRAFGDGDLTVTIPVQTELLPEQGSDGLHFSCELGGVNYGFAAVLDAGGAVLAASTRWTGDSIAISVTKEALEGAQWPITIDPLISTSAIDDFMGNLTEPDVSYDISTNRTLTVYAELFANVDRDIYARLQNADTGALEFEGYVHNTSLDTLAPRTANRDDVDAIVVWQFNLSPSISDIAYRTVSSLDFALGVIYGPDPTEFVSNFEPDVGGDIAGYFYIVYAQRDSTGNVDVLGTLVLTDNTPTFTSVALGFGPARQSNPSISNQVSHEGRWVITWEQGVAPSRAIYGAGVIFGLIFTPPYLIANISGDNFNSRVCFRNLDGQYLVVYENAIAGLPNIIGVEHMQLTTKLSSRWLNTLSLDSEQRNPDVANNGQNWVVVWSEEAGTQYNIYASTIDGDGLNLCESERRVRLNTNNTGDAVTPSIFSRSHAFMSAPRLHVVWSEDDGSDLDIWGSIYEVSPYDCLGWMSCTNPVANSTGQHSLIYGEGSHVAGGNPLTVRASRMPPNQFGYIVTGSGGLISGNIPPGSQGKLCVSGAIGRYNRNPSELQNSGPMGTFALSVDTLAMPTSPNQAIGAGSTWHFQAWHRDLNPGSTSNFTPMLSIVFD